MWVKSLLDLKQAESPFFSGRLILGTAVPKPSQILSAISQIFRFLLLAVFCIASPHLFSRYTPLDTCTQGQRPYDLSSICGTVGKLVKNSCLKRLVFGKLPRVWVWWFKVQVLRGAFFGEETYMATMGIRSWGFFGGLASLRLTAVRFWK